MEKSFILKVAHLPSNNVARYPTLDKNVDMVVFLKKSEWPNRIREECFRCGRCRCYIRPKEPKLQKGDFYYHKTTCHPKVVVPEKEIEDGIVSANP
jgi:hypothetical protein